MTRARIRPTMDFGRLAVGSARPGNDPRTWVSLARVDDDPDAVRWDEKLGWVADVTLTGGPLDQEGPIACRVATVFAGAGSTEQAPVDRGCEVVVLLPGGDPNASPIIVGHVHNGGGCEAPTAVNGDSLTEAKASGAHVLVTPHEVDHEVGGDVRVAAGGVHRILGPTVELAEEGATQAYVRGTDYAGALNTLLASMAALATALNADPALGVATKTAASNLVTAIVNFQARLVPGDLLSSRINGE